MDGHSKFLQWAREQHFKNRDECEIYNEPILDFDDYIFANMDFLIEQFTGRKIDDR